MCARAMFTRHRVPAPAAAGARARRDRDPGRGRHGHNTGTVEVLGSRVKWLASATEIRLRKTPLTCLTRTFPRIISRRVHYRRERVPSIGMSIGDGNGSSPLSTDARCSAINRSFAWTTESTCPARSSPWLWAGTYPSPTSRRARRAHSRMCARGPTACRVAAP